MYLIQNIFNSLMFIELTLTVKILACAVNPTGSMVRYLRMTHECEFDALSSLRFVLIPVQSTAFCATGPPPSTTKVARARASSNVTGQVVQCVFRCSAGRSRPVWFCFRLASHRLFPNPPFP